MSDKPSGIYNDIKRAVEAIGFTLVSVTDVSLSQATDGPLYATVTARQNGEPIKATWSVDWWPQSTRNGRAAVTFGSGDYVVIRDSKE